MESTLNRCLASSTLPLPPPLLSPLKRSRNANYSRTTPGACPFKTDLVLFVSPCRLCWWICWLHLVFCLSWTVLRIWYVSGFLLVCVWLCCPVAVVLLEYSEECWGGGCPAIWSLLPALHNKNRHTSTPVMDDKETGTGVVRGGGRRQRARASSMKNSNVALVVAEDFLEKL